MPLLVRPLAVLFALLPAACTTLAPAPNPPGTETAADVLQGISAAAGARELLAISLGRVRFLQPVSTWLHSADGCAATELLRGHADAGLRGVRAADEGHPLLPGGRVDLTGCAGLPRLVEVDLAAHLVVHGAIDVLQGGMLLGHVDERDPWGWAYACSTLELSRGRLPEWLRELSPDADHVVEWSDQPIDLDSCTATVRARAVALAGEG